MRKIIKNLPNFEWEEKLWEAGIDIVAGLDEVGRGCFAGPVVAACAVFGKVSKDTYKAILDTEKSFTINDSKKLTSKKREEAKAWIEANSLGFGIGTGSVNLINRAGIVRATNFAFRSALKNASEKVGGRIQYLLIDGFFIPKVKHFRCPKNNKKNKIFMNKKVNQSAIISGDSKIFSIAAASILAKVYRDNLMKHLGEKAEFKKYCWDLNKGYGTKTHRDAIINYGPTKHHRTLFIRNVLKSF